MLAAIIKGSCSSDAGSSWLAGCRASASATSRVRPRGVKASLAGPIRARIDYRVFTLGGEPLHSVVHRVYAGLNLAF